MSVRSSRVLRGASLAALGLLALGLLERSVQADLQARRDLHQVAYTGSRDCSRCHRDHDRTWRATFHRTMTQAASPQSVLGDFSDETLEYFGAQAHMERDAAGQYVIRYGGQAFPEQRYVVEKALGSRRYQQYVARSGDALVRLPVAFDLSSRRWFHMNGAFLTPDPDPTQPLARADYERHLTRWNDNCIFCHNVAANPGKHGAGFDSEVAELGIACEACHGPGSEHARRNANPLRRFTLHLRGGADPTIVNPARLDHERAADLCGRCHGQRVTDDISAFLAHGDPFIPGEDLALYSAPLWRDTTLRGESGLFEARFWSDGTPRLTAYEYQGLLQSPCYQRGELTCTSCHGMHEGDPRGQLRENLDCTRVCSQCHREYEHHERQVAHARHGDSPPDCVSCHMPPIVYGVLSVHPSHRVESPDPALSARDERPDACTLCHTDRTRQWAARERARMFGPSRAEPPATTLWSEIETHLFAGDPVERAIAAHALGSRTSSRGPRASALLLEAMRSDPYPVVRRFAAASLAAREPELREQLARFVPESPAPLRAEQLSGLRDRLGAPAEAAELLKLRNRASERAIDIGE